MNAKILQFPKKPSEPIIQALVSAGMRKPNEVFTIGLGEIAFEISGHDFYLKRVTAGYELRVHGEKEQRVMIARQPGAGDEKFEVEDVTKASEIIRKVSSSTKL
jgi:hypothetical protein